MYAGIQGSWVNTLSHCLTRVWPQTGRSPFKETASHVSSLNDPSLITCWHNSYIVNKSLCQYSLHVIELQATHILCPRAYFKFTPCVAGNFILIPPDRYKTSAAIIETEISTAELAQEARNRATQAQMAAKEAALIAEVTHRPYPYLTHAPG